MKRFSIGALLLGSMLAVACDGGGGGSSSGGADGGAPDSSTTGGDAGAGDAGDGGAGLLGFHPSNLDGADLESALGGALGDLLLDDCGPQVVSTDQGRAGCDAPGATYQKLEASSGDQKYWVFVARNIKVAKDRILDIRGDRPVILVALETIDIEGSIFVNEGMAGGFEAANGSADGAGPGAGKASGTSTAASGGGGAYCGKGGNGGQTGATGGTPYGDATLVPLRGGSSGAALFNSPGGGAIQLVAGRSIVLHAGSFIDARGGGNTAGGGSGGAVLIEAPEVTIDGSVTVNGGSGAASGGQLGQPGTRTSSPALGGQNATNGNGGNGGAGTQIDGTNGAANPDFPDGSNAASGGGGVGRIRINTRTGAATIGAGGLVSPALTTSCATQGTLR